MGLVQIGFPTQRDSHVRRVTKILGVYRFLKTVLGRERVAKPKPDPDIYLAAAEALGVQPKR